MRRVGKPLRTPGISRRPINGQKGWERAEPPDNGGHGKPGFQPLPEGEAVLLGQSLPLSNPLPGKEPANAVFPGVFFS